MRIMGSAITMTTTAVPFYYSVRLSSMYLGLGERVASASRVEALPDSVLLRAVRPDHCFHLLQGGVAAVGTKQPPRFLQTYTHK